MKSLLSSIFFVLTIVLPLSAFNVDPASFNLSMKKGEKKQVVLRIKNILAFPVVSSATVSGAAIVKVYPQKLKLDPGVFTYTNVDIKAPDNASGAVEGSVTFYVSGTEKNGKFRKTVVIPVQIHIKPNEIKTIPPK